MMLKYFVGLTFYPDNSFAKKIEHFRTRFDTKYNTNSTIHLPIVPSFEIPHAEGKKLQQELVEELESFYFDNLEHHVLKFNDLDVHDYKKAHILYLNPMIDEDLSFCQESLFSICQSYIVEREKKMKSDKKSFMTIGRFNTETDLHHGLDHARREFEHFTGLPFESICLFRQNNGIWYRESDLITFKRPTEEFLQSLEASL
jgi:hypothetical protein